MTHIPRAKPRAYDGNPFDLEDIDDLPIEIRSVVLAKGKIVDPIMYLFKIKNKLTLKEIMPALWRVFDLNPPNMHVQDRLSVYVRTGRLSREGEEYIYTEESSI